MTERAEGGVSFETGRLLAFHDACLDLAAWPGEPGRPLPAGEIWAHVDLNHASNARLWAEEDLARRRTVGDAEIAANKRAIDRLNQARNDAVERCDEVFMGWLSSAMASGSRLHSETPGMMIDRLSILALKVRAMRAQATRTDAGEEHRRMCAERLERLVEQRGDLAGCLDALIADCLAGRARFKLYRQFKMYNDPALNPSLYGEG
jgi:hypothetical protein